MDTVELIKRYCNTEIKDYTEYVEMGDHYAVAVKETCETILRLIKDNEQQ